MKAVEGKTPFEVLYGKKPNLQELREWGEEVWVHQEGGDKLGEQGKRGHWVGYDGDSNGSRIWYPDTGAVWIERNFRFVNGGHLNLEGEQQTPSSTIHNDPPHSPIKPTPEIQPEPQDSTPEPIKSPTSNHEPAKSEGLRFEIPPPAPRCSECA